jgi:hypothetical protein
MLNLRFFTSLSCPDAYQHLFFISLHITV